MALGNLVQLSRHRIFPNISNITKEGEINRINTFIGRARWDGAGIEI